MSKNSKKVNIHLNCMASLDIHDVLVDILRHFDSICKQNGISYCLAYGTLLGAIRHNGCIPWDDDIDVWMFREQFNALLNVLKSENASEKDYAFYYDYKAGDLPTVFQGKFVNKRLLCDREKFGETAIVHPWIDVFVLDFYPKNKGVRYLRSVKRHSILFNIYRLKDIKSIKKDSKGLRKMIYVMNGVFHFLDIIPRKKMQNFFLNSLTKYKSGEMLFCFATSYMDNIQKCSFEKEWFDFIEIGLFEGMEVPIPCGYHYILKQIYNDYLTLPPLEKRKNTHDLKNIRCAQKTEMNV